MIIISEKKNAKTGRLRITLELTEGEVVRSFHHARFYKLPDPVNEVMSGDVMIDAVPTGWSNDSQEWLT